MKIHRLTLVAVVLSAFLAGWFAAGKPWERTPEATELSVPKLIAALEKDEVSSANWRDKRIWGKLRNGQPYQVAAPDQDSPQALPITAALQASRSDWQYAGPSASEQASTFAILTLPAVLFGVLSLAFLAAAVEIVRRAFLPRA